MNYLNLTWQSKLNILPRTFWYIVQKFLSRSKLFEVPDIVQDNKMKKIGLSRAKGLGKLNHILNELTGTHYDENNGMFSEHLILFASIATKKSDIKKILEIGTYDGMTALILSRLFPQAEITTIDLPSNDPLFKDSYNRKNTMDNFLNTRNDYLKKAKNVNFKGVNSLKLCSWEESFDFIWIDGAHGYPVVAMDIINSFRLANNGAYIMIDDIFQSVSQSDKMYKSNGGYMSLKTLVEAKLIPEFYLFNKRLGSIHNMPKTRKYVGLFRKK